MDASEPTREQAEAALLEAGRRASQVRHADLQLRWMLLAILGAYLAVGLLMSVSPHSGSPLAAAGVLAVMVAAIAVAVVVAVRMRAYSRVGIRIYFGTMIAFNLWNAAVASTSIGTRFWASGQPSYHFGLSTAVAILPLAIGAALVARRSRP